MSFGISWAPGATTVGARFDSCVILGSEKRINFGGRVLSKAGKKVFVISENMAAACAGLVSDFQVLTSMVKAYVKLFELEHERSITVQSLAKLMSGILYQRRIFPYFTDTILGGIDENGPQLIVMDLIGSIIADDYAAIGTGAQVAIGILEEEYNKSLNIEDAKKLIMKSIQSAIERDPSSGNGMKTSGSFSNGTAILFLSGKRMCWWRRFIRN